MSNRCAILLLVLILASCRSPNEPAVTGNASSGTIVSSTPPFQTREPERYQATRTITIVAAEGKTVVTRSSVARDGGMRRHESETLLKKVVYLDLPEGKFVLLPEQKVYADLTAETGSPTGEEDEITPERLLHTGGGATTYQSLGKEMVGGRNANKYKTIVNSSSTGNVPPSETLIWIDEALNMPIRSETTSSDGTRMTMELSDVTLDVDKRIFQVPNDYEKIAFSELRKRLTAN